MLYHYTVGIHLPHILKDQCIKLATTLVPENEKPAVHCSIRNDYEPVAAKNVMRGDKVVALSVQETEEVHEGLYRIAVKPEAAPLTWRKYVKESGMEPRMRRCLEKVAFEKGSCVEEHRMSFEPIPASMWLYIEKHNPETGQWERVM